MTEKRCINCMRKLTDDSGACPHCGFDPGKYKTPEQALPPGATLNHGKYVVGRVLGRGGFGVTYVALDTTLDLRIAVKECLPRNSAWRDDSGASVQWGLSVPEQEMMLEGFVKEARKMARADEIPGVVRVREYFYDNETAYIVMDYVEGETLAQYLRRNGPLSAEACFRVLAPAMDSLAQAHKRGLIHRDISPNNIMIETGGERVWLLDLGAAKDLGNRLAAPNVSANTQIVGTPGYTPLEQYSPDGKIGPWTDVYAMSSTFFRSMTGQKLQASTSRALKDETPELLRTIRGPVGAVLSIGLAQNPDNRYQSMTELRDALETAIEDTAHTRAYADAPTEILVNSPSETPEPIEETPQPEPPEAVAETPPQRESPKAKQETLMLEEVTPQPETPKAEAVTPPDTPKAKRKARRKKGSKKPIIIAAVLAIALLAAFMCKPQIKRALLQVMPASGKCGDNVSWTLTKDGLLTISGAGKMRTSFYENPWKDYKDIITKVNILPGITTVGSQAFHSCTNLTSVEIPNGIMEIEGQAFYRCALTSIVIPDSVTEIEMYAFGYCPLNSVVIPDGVTEIGDGAFRDCKQLTDVVIPDSVTKIGEEAFIGCSGLASVSIPTNVSFEDWEGNSVDLSDVFDEHTTVTQRGETSASIDTDDGDEPEKTWALAQKEPEELWGITN